MTDTVSGPLTGIVDWAAARTRMVLAFVLIIVADYFLTRLMM